MAKQLISGAPKLKRKERDEQEKDKEDKRSLTLTLNEHSLKMHPKSFRLSSEDLSSLKKVVDSVNELSRGKISETKVLQGMIYMCTKIKPVKLMEAIKELM